MWSNNELYVLTLLLKKSVVVLLIKNYEKSLCCIPWHWIPQLTIHRWAIEVQTCFFHWPTLAVFHWPNKAWLGQWLTAVIAPVMYFSWQANVSWVNDSHHWTKYRFRAINGPVNFARRDRTTISVCHATRAAARGSCLGHRIRRRRCSWPQTHSHGIVNAWSAVQASVKTPHTTIMVKSQICIYCTLHTALWSTLTLLYVVFV